MYDLHRILVPRSKRADGNWSAARIVWAAFRLRREAEEYAERLHRENPEWIIEFRWATRRPV